MFQGFGTVGVVRLDDDDDDDGDDAGLQALQQWYATGLAFIIIIIYYCI